MKEQQVLTGSIKKAITADWANSFPTLDVYKPMRLLKRHGPLLLGIMLDRTRENNVYVPIFHVHNLLYPFSSIVLQLAYRVPDKRVPRMQREIPVARHSDEYLDAVSFLKEEVPIWDEKVLKFPSIVRLYGDYLRQKRNYHLANLFFNGFRDVILLAHWCGQHDYADACYKAAIPIMKKWNPTIDIPEWEESIRKLSDRETMERTLESELVTHKLQNVPVYDLSTKERAKELITDIYIEAWSKET